MKTSTKAALLSGLVFPGAGHFYLKRYLPGVLLTLAASIAVYLIASYAVQTALDIVQQIESGSVQPDIATITTLVTEKMHQTEEATNHLTIAFVALWLIGIFDSYRVGRILERPSGRPAGKPAKG
jgi:TM2 domain-containing membrane protein YozV